MPEFLDFKTIFILVHVFGAVLGAGGAFASDAMFFSTIKDGRINNQELRFLKLGGKLVWAGLIVLVVSGFFILFSDLEKYLSSTKFLAKATIVGVIIINGVIFHRIHIPHIQGHLGIKFSESRTFMKKASFLLASGAISVVSWVSTLILGTLKYVPYSYISIMTVYVFLVICTVAGALFMKRYILR
jgi:hypothetical protein